MLNDEDDDEPKKEVSFVFINFQIHLDHEFKPVLVLSRSFFNFCLKVKSYMPKNLGSVKGRWDQIESERKKVEEEKALVRDFGCI